MYILKTESGKYLSNENEFHVTKLVSEIEKATTFSRNDAIRESNIYFQLSGIKTELIKHGYKSSFTANYQSEY